MDICGTKRGVQGLAGTNWDRCMNNERNKKGPYHYLPQSLLKDALAIFDALPSSAFDMFQA